MSDLMDFMSSYTNETDSDGTMSLYQPLSDGSSDNSSEPTTPTIKFSSCKWTEEEDQRLAYAVQLYGQKSWRLISNYVGSKTNCKLIHS